MLTKCTQAERYTDLSAAGTPPSSTQLAAAAGPSPSDARALVAEFQTRPSPAGPAGQGRFRLGAA